MMTKMGLTHSDHRTILLCMATGRKTLLNPELERKLIEAVEVVYYVSSAANYVGISPATITKWMQLGEKHEKQFHPNMDECGQLCEEKEVALRRFMKHILQAQAKHEFHNMKSIKKHGDKFWMANAWALERTQPHKYGMINRTEIHHSGQVNVKHEISIERRQKILAAANKSLQIDSAQDEITEAEIIPVQSEDED